jgi:hypothetical protein
MTKIAKTARKTDSGAFVLGLRAFQKISAVEGIRPSKQLNADLLRVMELPAAKRRSVLSAKYGAKKG